MVSSDAVTDAGLCRVDSEFRGVNGSGCCELEEEPVRAG